MAEQKSDFSKMKPSEISKIVVDLHKQGNSPSKIGLILRDKHGVPKAKLLGKRVTEIIKEASLEVVPEKEEYNKKIKRLEGHITKNKHDYTAKRSLTKKLWIVNKL